ncbi:hypothetical protein CONPUDRAFT_71240 [Coniophora puteana RWD-64-598 SS2]|uniref:Uncharacterized protein n=1 Tax=Coniophora puteana (strain RWD-64-598) TaxID=741705 RepID=A0A5M3N0A3_CONPW|nr:uncharacterized protein CONPUDRAFT_71240 [Coniophora puteana RWD-64-598 SS2]EIW84474.1 hypothetical protein CONPUDRAFT_71240 [Coniophora puteana RWD-64-598 SS2]
MPSPAHLIQSLQDLPDHFNGVFIDCLDHFEGHSPFNGTVRLHSPLDAKYDFQVYDDSPQARQFFGNIDGYQRHAFIIVDPRHIHKFEHNGLFAAYQCSYFQSGCVLYVEDYKAAAVLRQMLEWEADHKYPRYNNFFFAFWQMQLELEGIRTSTSHERKSYWYMSQNHTQLPITGARQPELSHNMQKGERFTSFCVGMNDAIRALFAVVK